MKSRGQVWVSAVLYIALGMILITLILSAGIPLIDKMRDRNTIVQTKRLMFNLNSNIETVANEGVGSKRFISPIEISGGSLNVDYTKDLIIWKMTTKSLMMESNKLSPSLEQCIQTGAMNSVDCIDLNTFKEGALIMWVLETSIEGEYETYIELNYKDYLKLTYDPKMSTSLSGKYSFSIEHRGFEGDMPVIYIGVT